MEILEELIAFTIVRALQFKLTNAKVLIRRFTYGKFHLHIDTRVEKVDF